MWWLNQPSHNQGWKIFANNPALEGLEGASGKAGVGNWKTRNTNIVLALQGRSVKKLRNRRNKNQFTFLYSWWNSVCSQRDSDVLRGKEHLETEVFNHLNDSVLPLWIGIFPLQFAKLQSSYQIYLSWVSVPVSFNLVSVGRERHRNPPEVGNLSAGGWRWVTPGEGAQACKGRSDPHSSPSTGSGKSLPAKRLAVLTVLQSLPQNKQDTTLTLWLCPLL